MSQCYHGYKGQNFHKVFKQLILSVTSIFSTPPGLKPSQDAVFCPLVEKRCYWLGESTYSVKKSVNPAFPLRELILLFLCRLGLPGTCACSLAKSGWQTEW